MYEDLGVYGDIHEKTTYRFEILRSNQNACFQQHQSQPKCLQVGMPSRLRYFVYLWMEKNILISNSKDR